MELILEHPETGEIRQLKMGNAWYILIPVGNLIISILRKQFKWFLSIWLLNVVLIVVLFILALLTIVFGEVSEVLGVIFYLLYYGYLIFLIIFSFYILIKSIMNLNYWSYNQYMIEGYKVKSENSLEVNEFIEKASQINRPNWLFFL